MYSNALETLPDPADHEFPGKAGVILAGLRTPKKARNGIGLRADLIEAIEAEETPTEDEAARIKELIAALGG